MSFTVTTPIYYVNGAPHLGHAYTTIAADVLARHHRRCGEDVFFLTGTDEHGEPVALAAEKQGMTPQALADQNAERFKALAPQLDASNDFFIRTTDEQHKLGVQQVLQTVKDNGFVELGRYEGWYCPRCADFKSENEVEDGDRCPIHHIVLTRESEENWFFKLSAFQERLEALYAEQPDFVLPVQRRNEALAFIQGGLQDVSLSRGAKLQWGVQVPWDPEHVFYVWFDALLNYYTALAYAKPGEDLTERFWPATFHIVGKDILKFHCVFWPAILMAAGLPVPQHVLVHGYLLMNDEKMSKSLGNVLDPFTIIERFGVDPLRFYLLRDVQFGGDGEVSAEAFEQRYESELANDLGNLASRVSAMVVKYRDGAVPAVGAFDLTEDFDGLADAVAAHLDRGELTQALEAIWVRVRRLNRYVEEQAPWKLAKDEALQEQLDVALATLIEGLRTVMVLLAPYLPATSATLLEALGAPDDSWAAAAFGTGGVTQVAKVAPLFPKHDATPA
ncbi:MAG: metG [Solirubrobacterales bacterium]|jgi:methionyl-tRNA synthetase|nr:metG [Solirubrobacterales bacterium]